ncbi:MAG: endonuclease [Bacteroidales bacterium]|nr:endonuclease [Bacteroidales bacterium]
MIKKSLAAFAALILAGFIAVTCFAGTPGNKARKNLKLVYWNIQNGMWSGQGENYDSFVKWVRKQKPDICVWCEAQSIWETGTAKKMPEKDRYLTDNWGELAARYGHKYWAIGAHRDNYPQVVTSKYPIETVKKIAGEAPDSIVTHGAGWFRINVDGQELNIVTLHTWPQAYAYQATNRDSSKAVNGGDHYRRMEIEYICRHTVAGAEDDGLWMMMGDFNSRSRVDDYKYKKPENYTGYLVHDYIAGNTFYIDAVERKHPGTFITSTGGESRIDYLYCSPKLYEKMKSADIISDSYTTPVRDPEGLSNFWHPSDHRPIVAEFDLRIR